MHRGDHFLCEHSSNASSWDEQRCHKLIAQPSVFQIEGPICRWHLLSDESGFTRELVSWLTNHPDLAEALEQWRESVSGIEPDRHVQVMSGLASVRYPLELVESFLGVLREDPRGDEELSNVAVLTAGPSPHENCLAEEIFVDDVRA